MRRAAIFVTAAFAALTAASAVQAQQYISWAGRDAAMARGETGAPNAAAQSPRRRPNPVIPHGGFAQVETADNRLTPAPGSNGRLTPANAWLNRRPQIDAPVQPQPQPERQPMAGASTRQPAYSAPAQPQPAPQRQPQMDAGPPQYGQPEFLPDQGGRNQPVPSGVVYPANMPPGMAAGGRDQPMYQAPMPEARPVYNEQPSRNVAAQRQPQPQPQPQMEERPQPAAARPGYSPVPRPEAAPVQPQPQPTSAPAADASVDPYAPRRDAPVFRMQQQQAQPAPVAVEPAPAPVRPTTQGATGQSAANTADREPRRVAMVQANPNDRPATQNGSRYYSVHRDSGREPDAVILPAPTYVDAMQVSLQDAPASPDLAQPQAGPALIRDNNGRVRAAPAASDGDYQ